MWGCVGGWGLTASNRLVRMCFLSLSVKFDGTSLLSRSSCVGMNYLVIQERHIWALESASTA